MIFFIKITYSNYIVPAEVFFYFCNLYRPLDSTKFVLSLAQFLFKFQFSFPFRMEYWRFMLYQSSLKCFWSLKFGKKTKLCWVYNSVEAKDVLTLPPKLSQKYYMNCLLLSLFSVLDNNSLQYTCSIINYIIYFLAIYFKNNKNKTV